MKQHKIRVLHGERTVGLTPTSAIRYFCSECVQWQLSEVRLCTAVMCPLYPFRSAIQNSVMTDEHLARAREHGKEYQCNLESTKFKPSKP